MAQQMALFTIQQSDPIFLGVWLDYYSQHFESCDIYVLDHYVPGEETAQTLCAEYGIHYFPMHNALSYDHRWMQMAVRDFHRFLFHSYETVMFAEVDELVVHTKGSLRAFILGNTEPVVRPMGLNIFHDKGEPPLDFTKPILAQRRYGYLAPRYSKPMIGREPIEWDIGFHGATKMPAVCADLINCHLHRVDFDTCMARHIKGANRKWSQWDRQNGMGVQYYSNNLNDIAHWFYQGADLGPKDYLNDKVEIPAEIKRAF